MDNHPEYARLADEALAACSPGSGSWIRWNDDRVGKTHAVILGGEVGDPLTESNLHVGLDVLRVWLGDDEADAFESTVGRSGRTWLRILVVRVYDDAGRFTDAWKTAVDHILLRLEDYPLLDEDDFYEREWEAHYESLRWDYGDSVDLVVAALQEHGRYGIDEYIGDHDEVVQLVEHHLNEGLWQEEVNLTGLKHYIEQRKDDLDIPTLASLVG